MVMLPAGQELCYKHTKKTPALQTAGGKFSLSGPGITFRGKQENIIFCYPVRRTPVESAAKDVYATLNQVVTKPNRLFFLPCRIRSLSGLLKSFFLFRRKPAATQRLVQGYIGI